MKHQQARLILAQIEAELKALALWSSQPPTPEAMASTLPFCCDTMSFANWLQFILLPRLQALLDGQLPLPSSISLCPMAEEAFKAEEKQALVLINRIGDLDELLSGQRVQTVVRV